jgi:ankyrin repeat protein
METDETNIKRRGFTIPFELKLGIFLILLFGIMITFCVLWNPLTVQYYRSQLKSGDMELKIAAISALLELGKSGNDALAKEFNNPHEMDLICKYWKEFDKNNKNALFEAVEYKSHKAVELFLARGADPNARAYKESGSRTNIKGQIVTGLISILPLHLAQQNDDIKTAKVLIKYGAKIDVYDELLETFSAHSLLQLAVKNNNTKFVKLYLESGANPEFPDLQGYTPIFYVKSIEAAELLIKYGANVNAQAGLKGKTALDDTWLTPKEVVEYLRAHGAKTSEELKNQK